MSSICKFCQKVFSKQSNVNRHIREVHNLKTNPFSNFDQSKWNYKCLELNCNSSFQQNKGLITHLGEVHDKMFEQEKIIFTNESELQNWKCAIEIEYKCNYVVSSRWNSTKGQIIYYNCNRSNTGKPLCQKRQRLLKSQGSCKLSFGCTSQIKIINEEDSNRISVFWQKTHYGHPMELQHIRLSMQDRQLIAAKLISGIPTTKIVDLTRDKIQEQIQRIDLLTTKDVNNIRKKYNIEMKDGRRHENDAISIDLWVEECKCKPPNENPILFYKKQGEESTYLEKNDFCLIIMNNFQEIMLNKFGNNVIAIDGTHGLNNYDFELTTIMILDEFGEGFPVTFMFSNRKDTHIYTVLFQTLKDKIGPICAKTFMSDLAEAFYKAWFVIMGPVTYHLFCSWHVDRAWQTNLPKISNIEKRKEVYKMVKVLQEEMDETQFKHKLTSALNFMLNDSETNKFGRYFQSNYANNSEQWAYCFRKTAGINTNMRLESMHKTIKYFYLDHKKIKRLDKGLHAVLKFLRNKSVERVIKMVKGKNTIYNKDIFKRHIAAINSNFEVNRKSETCWEITNKLEKFLVNQLIPSSCCNLSCSTCKICYHMYSCNCYDYMRKSAICKHIHYVALNNSNKSDINNLKGQLEKSDIDSSFVCALVNQTSSKELNSDLEEKIRETFQSLQSTNFGNLDDTIILQIHTHLSVLKNLTRLTKNNDVKNHLKDIENNKEPCNKNIRTQTRLFSTQKKRKNASTVCKKPNKEETDVINKILNDKPVLYISRSAENDHAYL